MSYLIGLFVLYNADNLEEFGIFPGSSEPADENRELTDDEKLQKIRESIGSMPEELQVLFQDVLNQSDPIKESFKNETEIQREMQIQDIMNNREAEEPDMRFYDESVGDAQWANIDKNIFESYFEGRDTGASQFNVDDWV